MRADLEKCKVNGGEQQANGRQPAECQCRCAGYCVAACSDMSGHQRSGCRVSTFGLVLPSLGAGRIKLLGAALEIAGGVDGLAGSDAGPAGLDINQTWIVPR